MSYSLIDLPVFEQVANAVYHYNSAPKNMFWCLRGASMDVIKQHVTNWCEANEQTCIGYYHEPGKNEKRQLKLNLLFNSLPLTRYQLIKWLESIINNISTVQLTNTLLSTTVELLGSYQILDHIIRDLALSIVHDNPMYVNAKY